MSTIFLVEDEPLVRELIAEHLESLGYQVRSFETADLAWAHIETLHHPVPLLITGLRLPGELDGIDLVKRICGMAAQTPVVVISGFQKNAHCLRGDHIYWLSKPFPLEHLDAICLKLAPPG